MQLEEWKEKNQHRKGYAHFDKKVSLENVWDYINNPDNIKKHGFYPFIHYQQIFRKYRKVNGVKQVKRKERDICYCAHIDGYIYSYYAYLVNEAYNKYMKEHQIDRVAVAYRSNLHKSNIHFAKRAFQQIQIAEECYIITGDFSNFFDCLEHCYLKKQLCEVLKMDSLPDDYYAVFKNITKYATWERDDLLTLNGLGKTYKDIRALNVKQKVLDEQKFRKYKSTYLKKHKESYGIPQGTALSAVLANVYMIKFDEEIHHLSCNYNGLYMRYSDDFIIILPKISQEEFQNVFEKIKNKIQSVPNLELQSEKTSVYYYKDSIIANCNTSFLKHNENVKNEIDYLGFTFDGKQVVIRDKTITKYYDRLYRKLKTIQEQQGYTKKGNRISNKKVYELYSIKGANGKDTHNYKQGNFISYVNRSQRIFGENEPINRKTKRHMLKIRRKLDEIEIKY